MSTKHFGATGDLRTISAGHLTRLKGVGKKLALAIRLKAQEIGQKSLTRKDVLEIDGMSEQAIESLEQNGWVKWYRRSKPNPACYEGFENTYYNLWADSSEPLTIDGDHPQIPEDYGVIYEVGYLTEHTVTCITDRHTTPTRFQAVLRGKTSGSLRNRMGAERKKNKNLAQWVKEFNEAEPEPVELVYRYKVVPLDLLDEEYERFERYANHTVNFYKKIRATRKEWSYKERHKLDT